MSRDGLRTRRACPSFIEGASVSVSHHRSHVSLDSLLGRVTAAPFFARLRSEVADLQPGDRLRLKGTVGSLPAFVLADLATRDLPVCCLLPEPDAAAYLQSDLEQILGEFDDETDEPEAADETGAALATPVQ